MKRPKRRKGPAAPEPAKSSKPAPPRRPRSMLPAIVVVGVVLIASAVVLLVRIASNPVLKVPDVDVTGLEPDVQASIAGAQAQVLDDTGSAEAWGHYGMVLMAYQFTEAANTCFVEAEQIAPDSFRWPYYQGMNVALQNAERAVECFRRSVERAPQDATIRLRLSEFLFDMGRRDECREQLDRALQLEPNNPRAQLGMARILFEKEQYREALDWARRAADGAPYRVDTHELLSKIHHRLGDSDAAERELERVAEAPSQKLVWPDPLMLEVGLLRKDTTVLSVAAEEARRRKEFGLAVALFRKIIELHPDVASWKVRLANVYLEADDLGTAAQTLDLAIATNPDAADLHVLRGIVDARQGNHSSAVDRFQRALSLKRDYYKAYLNLGRSYIALGQLAEAKAALGQAVETAPHEAEARDELAALEARMNEDPPTSDAPPSSADGQQ